MDMIFVEFFGKERDYIVEFKKDVRWECKLFKLIMKMVVKMWFCECGNDVYYFLVWIKGVFI